MNKLQRHEQLAKELTEIYAKKNTDYGDSFGKTYRALGIISAVTRITDKYNRLVSLATSKQQLVSDESIIDTLKDLANYALMTVMEIESEDKTTDKENLHETKN